MAKPPSKNEFRRLWTGVGLIAACVLAVAVGRATQKPWMPDAPAYRQKGPADAKAVLAEFGDFQCPPCGRAVGVVRNIEHMYGSKLRVVFKHCPWTHSHPWAMTAAIASECAGKQGKFWEMFDKLYDNQPEWTQTDKAADVINGYAYAAKVDRAAYDQCVKGGEGERLVKEDMKDVSLHFINSTPTFFINGKRFGGAGQLSREGVNDIDRILGK
ncbi:MAG: thioredoxin domain-containing protein [Elusimicrobia bacterium]|nr:thioredoxin domain-containing protein [Elusimicrobiota bacterium]